MRCSFQFACPLVALSLSDERHLGFASFQVEGAGAYGMSGDAFEDVLAPSGEEKELAERCSALKKELDSNLYKRVCFLLTSFFPFFAFTHGNLYSHTSCLHAKLTLETVHACRAVRHVSVQKPTHTRTQLCTYYPYVHAHTFHTHVRSHFCACAHTLSCKLRWVQLQSPTHPHTHTYTYTFSLYRSHATTLWMSS